MQVILEDDHRIDAQTLGKFKENFRLLDTNKDGKLNHQETGILFRAFGQNPTDDDLQAMLAPLPPLITLDEFCSFFKEHYRPPISEEVLISAFRIFDLTDKGLLSVEKFRDVMTSLGEPLPAAEIDEIMGEIQV